MESRNSCSVNPQLVWDMQNSKKNLMPIQICLYSFNSVAYGSQNQLFDALQEGKWQAGKPVLSADSTYGRFCVFQLHKHLYLNWGRKYLSWWSCIPKSHGYTLITHMVPPWITFCPGPAGSSRHFGTNPRNAKRNPNRNEEIIVLEPFSPLNQATNGHFQNYQKWSRFNGNYKNRRTSVVWLMVLSTKIDTACVQMFWLVLGTNADCFMGAPGSADVSNTE